MISARPAVMVVKAYSSSATRPATAAIAIIQTSTPYFQYCPRGPFGDKKGGTMADDKKNPRCRRLPTTELRSAKLAEDPTERVAAELTRMRFEMKAIRELLALL